MYPLLRYVPRNLLSFAFGKVAAVRLPRRVAGTVNSSFARAVGADLSEAEHPPEHYSSLGEFFLRNLRTGIRPLGPGVVSPVDGRIDEHGTIEESTLVQAKGRYYALERLLKDDDLADRFEGGYFITIYLSPRDYHHIHAPLDAQVSACYYIPGTLWPVNAWSVGCIDELFCVNERLITLLETELGLVAVVKVGATNVGSISVTYDSLRTNGWNRLRGRLPGVTRRSYDPMPELKKGDRLGSFHLGSTVILLFEPNRFHPGERCTSGQIRLGETLSTEESTHR